MDELHAAMGVLDRAAQIERDGRQFYLKSAESAREASTRETFSTLAQEEQTHLDLIVRQRNSLAREGRWIAAADFPSTPADLVTPLFRQGKEALEKAARGASSDLSALLFGLDIENRSFEMYCWAARQVKEPLGKGVFEFLAGEERRHFDTLMMRYEALAGPIAWKS